MDDATNIDDTATEETVEETTDGGMDTATETPDMGGDDTTTEE